VPTRISEVNRSGIGKRHGEEEEQDIRMSLARIKDLYTNKMSMG
jgi:hypothetical protein